MKKTYISSDFLKKEINGVNTIKEKSNFFSSIIIDIPDNIDISDNDIIWYENYNNEQIDLDSELNIEPVYYSTSNDKKQNHILKINENQPKSQLEFNTLWDLEIFSTKILFNHIYSLIKQNRTFEGLINQKFDSLDIDIFIEKYIIVNILPKYKLSKVNLFIKHVDIKNNLKYKNIWNSNIENEFIYNKYTLNNKTNSIELTFSQNNSGSFIFEYYYSLFYERI
jgi:hypothetical protein